ncbi:MAG: HD domain-containing protein, partial [Phycisphaerae bacterium]
TGGTFTNLARMSIRRTPEGIREGRVTGSVRGYELEYDEVREILAWLRAMSPAARREVPGLGFRRSEIIVAGLCVIERLMSQLNVRRVRVHDGGIRDGLLMEMIDELHLLTNERLPAHGEAMHAVRKFAELCQYPRAHSEHVAKLALRIFDQLTAWASDRAAAWSRPGARDLLEAAGVLHDVGQLIDFDKHHKHSYSMITHADLTPFSRRQVEIIASVARYHRKKGPSLDHPNMQRLSVVDQQLVKDLSGILRIADGLDRLHTQNVQDVVLKPRPDCVAFEVEAIADPTVNIQYALKKSGVFSQAFRTKVEFADPGALPRNERSDSQYV